MALDAEEYGKAATVRFLIREAKQRLTVDDDEDWAVMEKLETALWLLDELVEIHGRQWRRG